MGALYVDNGYWVDDSYAQTGITVNWATRNIFVPRSELSLVQTTPTYVYDLDLDVFRLALKDLEDNADAMFSVDTHRHNTTVVLSGVTYARVIEIINDFTVEFEDGQYAVNLVGANSNVADRVIVNQVSVRASNSAGLIEVNTTGGSDLTAADVWGYSSRTLTTTPAYNGPSAATIAGQVWDTPYADHKIAGTFGKLMDILRKANLSVEGAVNDPSAEATTTVFKTNVAAVSGAYDHQLLVFTTGPLMHEARPIDTYASTNGTIVLQEPLTSIPSNLDEFVILVQHVHPMHEIADQVITTAATTPIASNIKKVNDVTVTGNGQLGTEWGPA